MAKYVVKTGKGLYRNQYAIRKGINYVCNPNKTHPHGIVGGAVSPDCAVIAMQRVISAYQTEGGLALRHSALSFEEQDEISYDEAAQVAKEAIDYYSPRYQIVAAVHHNEKHLHIHMVMNTTSYVDGRKYNGTYQDFYGFQEHLNHVLEPYGITV